MAVTSGFFRPPEEPRGAGRELADAASRAIENAMRCAPDQPGFHYVHGVALCRLDRFDEAIQSRRPCSRNEHCATFIDALEMDNHSPPISPPSLRLSR
jgi:hypothetical protein